jgi:SLA1 homology domain 1, SHD1
MRRSIRTPFVCLIIALITYQPLAACHSCGGGGGYGGYYVPVYYGGYYSGGCCGAYAETVVVSDCCGGCSSCDAHEVVKVEGRSEAEVAAPAAKPEERVVTPHSEAPATIPPSHPVETTPPPTLPPQVTPVTPPQTTPVTPPVEPEKPADLFNDMTPTPPAETPATTPPATTPPATTPPATTPPATTPPAEKPAETDLFGTPSTDTKSGTSTTTNKPTEEPTATESKPAEKPAEPAAEEKKPEEKKADEKKAEEEKDPLFGSLKVLREAGGLASNEVRVWNDNTGKFSCHGRLIQFRNGHVRLIKDNGRTTTVPLARLSNRDLEFVNRQAAAQQAEVGKTAHAPAVLPGFAN